MMTDKELERRLARELVQESPNDLEGILSRCEKQEGKVIQMENSGKPRGRNWRALIAACLALVLAGGGGATFYQQANAVASVVSLDVNPSIELRVNKDQRVLSCAALNEDAETVLAEMDGGADLEGAKLDVAVNAVVGALVRHGYLDGLSNAILVSVEDKDQARAAQMEEDLKNAIGDLLAAEAPNTTILSQCLPMEAYGTYCHHGSHNGHCISTGKAALVGRVMEMNGTLDLNDDAVCARLSALTVEELNDLLMSGETRLPIGRGEAVAVVEEYAGTLALSSVTADVDPELDEGIYEVELYTTWGAFEYKVDAFTGAILSGPANLLELAAPTTTPTPEVAPSPAVTDSPVAQPRLTADQAYNAALRHCGDNWPELLGENCYLETNELDWEDGREVYEVEFLQGGYEFEYELDAYTGTILKWDTDYKGSASAAPLALIGEEAAWSAVYDHVGCAAGDVNFAFCELDYDDDLPHCYELEFCWNGLQYEYEVDCHSGAILKYEHETCNNGYHGHGYCGSGRHGGRHHGW